jgi:trehalose 6-phosphate synthase/phosphatase
MMQDETVQQYRTAYKRLILLDYDGTLVNFAPTPEKAVPSSRVVSILERLSKKPRTKVVITTGRKNDSIDSMLGNIPIDIIAEHGAMIKEDGRWRDLIDPDVSWKQEILELMERVTNICSGSWIEEKKFSISWHYRNADPMFGYILSRRLLRLVKVRTNPYKVKILDGNKTIEVMTFRTGKDKAVDYCLNKQDYDYILSIGDDKTDEDMFEALLGRRNAITVKVGQGGETYAKHRVESTAEVLDILEQL